jgi:hypothetical protein
LSIVDVLLVVHAASSAVLLTVLWLVMGVQGVWHLVERLSLSRDAAAAARSAVATAAARFPAVDRRRPLQSST